MVDLTEAGPAVLVARGVAMVLDAEAAHFRSTAAQVGNGVDIQVIHHVAGIVVDLDALVIDLANDFGAGGACARLSAVLLHDDGHSVITRHGSKLPEPLDPELAIAPLGMAEGEHLGNAAGLSLADAVLEHLECGRVFGIDSREHQQRLEAQVAASLAELTRRRW